MPHKRNNNTDYKGPKDKISKKPKSEQVGTGTENKNLNR